MEDRLIRAIAFNGEVRIFAIKGTAMVEEARRRHDTWHTATAALGRSLLGTALLAANLKGEDSIGVEILGSGPLGRIQCYGDSLGNIRGYVQEAHVSLPANSMGKIDVKAAVGLPGSLVVSKQSPGFEPFAGKVPLVSGEIAEDFTYYMTSSEQTPSSFGLSVLVNPDHSVAQAGGFMLQLLPGASEQTIQYLETNIGQITQLSQLFQEGLTLEELVENLAKEGAARIISEEAVQFKCLCSKEQFADRLALLDSQIIEELITEDQGAETICHYCNNKYQFSQDDLAQILANKINTRNTMSNKEGD